MRQGKLLKFGNIWDRYMHSAGQNLIVKRRGRQIQYLYITLDVLNV